MKRRDWVFIAVVVGLNILAWLGIVALLIHRGVLR